MRIFFLGGYFLYILFRKTRQPFTRISPSKNRRYSIEKPEKSVAAGEMSTNKLAEDQDTEKEVIHVAMKYVLNYSTKAQTELFKI